MEHTSEIRVTCVFGRPVAAVSYRPSDASGSHDVMFDASGQHRESALRRVVAYLRALDDARLRAATATAAAAAATATATAARAVAETEAATATTTAATATAAAAEEEERRDTWARMCEVAEAVAAHTDFLRVDFFLDAASGHFWVNEMDPTYAYVTAIGFHGCVRAVRACVHVCV